MPAHAKGSVPMLNLLDLSNLNETPVPLGRVPRQFTDIIPRRRNDRRVHVSTIHRWATRGANGERLAVVRIGGSLCTTRSALLAFFAAATNPTTPGPHAGAENGRQHRADERALEAIGI